MDADGYFDINWELTATDARLAKDAFENLLRQDQLRAAGQPVENEKWKDKLVVIGSIATGNDLTDRGATPLERRNFS